ACSRTAPRLRAAAVAGPALSPRIVAKLLDHHFERPGRRRPVDHVEVVAPPVERLLRGSRIDRDPHGRVEICRAKGVRDLTGALAEREGCEAAHAATPRERRSARDGARNRRAAGRARRAPVRALPGWRVPRSAARAPPPGEP